MQELLRIEFNKSRSMDESSSYNDFANCLIHYRFRPF